MISSVNGRSYDDIWSDIQAGHNQHAMLYFPGSSATGDVFLMDNDISTTGITYTETLNGEEDLTFGKAVMANVTAELLNYDNHLAGVTWTNEFQLYFGTERSVYTTTVSRVGTIDADIGIIASKSGYPVEASWGLSEHVAFAGYGEVLASAIVYALVELVDQNIYAIGSDGSCIGAWSIDEDNIPTPITVPTFNATAKYMFERCAGSGTCFVVKRGTGYIEYSEHSFALDENKDYITTTDFALKGYFKGKRPSRTADFTVSIDASDRMQLLDKNADAFAKGLTYPTTIQGLWSSLCTYLNTNYSIGIPSTVFPSWCVNGARNIASNPFESTTVTARDVAAYIAEAVGAYVHINRLGQTELVWFTNHSSDNPVFLMTDCYTHNVGEYTTPAISGVAVEAVDDDGEKKTVLYPENATTGVYTISSNVLLPYDGNGSDYTYAEDLYDHVYGVSAYVPFEIEATGNWLVETGDYVVVYRSSSSSDAITSPLFEHVITWSGLATSKLTCTGAYERDDKAGSDHHDTQIAKANQNVTRTISEYVLEAEMAAASLPTVQKYSGSDTVTKSTATDIASELNSKQIDSDLTITLETDANPISESLSLSGLTGSGKLTIIYKDGSASNKLGVTGGITITDCSCRIEFKYIIAAYKIVRSPRVTFVDCTGSIPGGTPISETVTITAKISDTYMATSAQFREERNRVFQGKSSSYGFYYGCIWFDLSSIPSTATFTALSVKVKRMSQGGSTVDVCGNYSPCQSPYKSFSTSSVTATGATYSCTANHWATLSESDPDTVGQVLRTGCYVLYYGANNSSYYCDVYGATSLYPPELTVTYTYTPAAGTFSTTYEDAELPAYLTAIGAGGGGLPSSISTHTGTYGSCEYVNLGALCVAWGTGYCRADTNTNHSDIFSGLFASAPYVIASWSKKGSNVSGNLGVVKVYNITANGFYTYAGGSLPTSDVSICWVALGAKASS